MLIELYIDDDNQSISQILSCWTMDIHHVYISWSLCYSPVCILAGSGVMVRVYIRWSWCYGSCVY